MINLLDPNCSADANLQHILHVFEGYRSYFLQYDLVEYSSGSAQDNSFQFGWDMAEKDWTATK